ncbi:Hamartin [Papilio xuthus]|uniref:Hamartin n=1 Tax=Papilio xuthus TaxID=66420 RepID=A0A194Q4H0_PAPXU|nr:Hamartin [Papilio xuthus]
MLAACEAGEVFALLESRDAADAVGALYAAVREPWLTRALLLYHARTGAARALDLLARAPEPHARHLLDALLEQMRGERVQRHHALAALAPLVARRPAWLHRLPAHPLAPALLRAARLERDPLPLLHALLTLAALLHAAPALAAPHWPDLADALLRPAALDPPPSPAARAHLQLAQLALFHALYATHPCTLLETLRGECAGPPARDWWERGLAPLLHSVRLHPALVTGSRQREADTTRWTRHDIHDVVAESRRLSIQPRDRTEERAASASCAPTPAPPPASPLPGSVAHAARSASSLRPGTEPWFALADRCGADSAPHTPLPAEPEAVEPPEAAVEATPENTPAKETRAQFRFPTESAAVRAIGRRSQPPSPMRKETSPPGDAFATRLSRVALERRAVESPVPFGGAPPPAVARPEPSRAAPAIDGEPLNVEDREVLELTARARAEDAWPDAEAAEPRTRDPRRLAAPLATLRAPRRRAAPPPRRAASCSPRIPAARTAAVAVQSVETAGPAPPRRSSTAPRRLLLAAHPRRAHRRRRRADRRHLARAVRVPHWRLLSQPDRRREETAETAPETVSPCERLDKYLADLYAGRPPRADSELAEQLALAHAQLLHERWRREAHAERNRRLLGRCRQARALELQNAALRDQLRAAHLERDELRARLRDTPALPAHAAAAAAAGEREAQLQAALADQTAARLRAEAALHEAEERRALDVAELQRTRGESFEAARHVEMLARTALAAERRAEHVRRLRRELLVLAEREARLSEAARAAIGVTSGAAAERNASEERALRAALARAEAEADANAARAEAAVARAHELETTLSARDAALAELRRALRHAGEEHAARQRALQDKYAALLCIVRTGESRKLELLAGEGGEGGGAARGGPRAGGAGGPLAARPALADCNRVRRLVCEEDEPALERS